ncbi:MAG: hypothetical protein JXQ90_02210 [Cyclobacteriaceae bacterium]
MRLIYVLIFLFGGAQLALSQIRLIDSAEHAANKEYLVRKLSFTYYSDDQNLWWINRMSYDKKSGELVYRNNSAEDPRKISGKKYIQRSFLLSDLNPYNIEKLHIGKTVGRIVKGEEIILHTVKNERKITKVLNTLNATPQSFLHISIPEYLDDSVHLADSVIMKFKESVFYETRLSNKGSFEENVQQVMDALKGDFTYENNAGEVRRFLLIDSDRSLSFEDYQDRKKLGEELWVFDDEGQASRTRTSLSGEETIDQFSFMDGDVLVLTNSDGSEKYVFENRSLYYLEKDGVRTDFKFLK